jgi:hypothetical protein
MIIILNIPLYYFKSIDGRLQEWQSPLNNKTCVLSKLEKRETLQMSTLKVPIVYINFRSILN